MHMGERVDAEGGVVDEDGAPEEADHETGPAADQPTQHPEPDRRNEFVPMQPHQLGIAREIGNLDEVGLAVTTSEDPADMAVPEALVARRVNVALGVGKQVMMAVLGGPPQHALLRRALRQQGKNELEGAAGREGAMREVAMIAGPDSEDAQPIEHEANGNRLPSDAGPDRRRAGEMHQHEGDGGGIDDVAVGVARLVFGRSSFCPGRVTVIERHEYVLQPSGRGPRSYNGAPCVSICITPASAGPSKALPRRKAAASWARPCRSTRGQGRVLLPASGGGEVLSRRLPG